MVHYLLRVAFLKKNHKRNIWEAFSGSRSLEAVHLKGFFHPNQLRGYFSIVYTYLKADE